MKLKTVFRLDAGNKLYRLFRLIWRRGRGPGVGAPDNYDASISFAICPPWWAGFRRECDGWRLWFAGLRLHRETSYGGVIV
jgi:hypothetical protein